MDGFNETHKSFISDDPSYREKTGGIIVGPHLEGYYILLWYNKDVAIDFLLFWSRPQVAEKWVRYTKAPTGVKGHLTTGIEGTDIYEEFQSELTNKYQGNVHDSADVGFILGEENKLLVDELFANCIKILKGEMTAQEAYDEVMANVA